MLRTVKTGYYVSTLKWENELTKSTGSNESESSNSSEVDDKMPLRSVKFARDASSFDVLTKVQHWPVAPLRKPGKILDRRAQSALIGLKNTTAKNMYLMFTFNLF